MAEESTLQVTERWRELERHEVVQGGDEADFMGVPLWAEGWAPIRKGSFWVGQSVAFARSKVPFVRFRRVRGAADR